MIFAGSKRQMNLLLKSMIICRTQAKRGGALRTKTIENCNRNQFIELLVISFKLSKKKKKSHAFLENLFFAHKLQWISSDVKYYPSLADNVKKKIKYTLQYFNVQYSHCYDATGEKASATFQKLLQKLEYKTV